MSIHSQYLRPGGAPAQIIEDIPTGPAGKKINQSESIVDPDILETKVIVASYTIT